MTKPKSTTGGARFDLAAVDREMRLEEAYAREGHTARTLVREPDLRIVLIAMKANSRIAEHQAERTVSVHTLSGRVRLRLPDEVVDVPAGSVLVLAPGLRHDVETDVDSSFLLTLGWQATG